MRDGLKDSFIALWREHFAGADLPICFFYADETDGAEEIPSPAGHRCLLADLGRVRKGRSVSFEADSVGCPGAARYMGFSQEIMPDFEHFLSKGIPGKMEGERYKKSPELVLQTYKHIATLTAPAKYIVFKRWDALAAADEPEVVIFFARPDVLSGLFTLSNFDESDPNSVICPFSAGCASIVQYPYVENVSTSPRAVLGMMDISARPCVPRDTLTFAVPMRKFVRMIENMPESFLTTPSWSKVKKRMGADPAE